MRRVKRLLLALGLLAIPLLAWAALASAQSFKSGANVTVPSGQTVNNTLFAAGRTVDIAGDVNGDVFCAGDNVTVSGRVHGDIICAGQNLTVTGQVTGDVRLAGQNVTLGAQVGGSATIGAQSFTQQPGSVVQRDLSVGSADATLNGRVGRDVAGGNTTLTIGGRVGRNLQASVGHLKLENGARVAGNVTYASANKLSKAQNAQVGGTITQSPPAQKHHGWSKVNFWELGLYVYVSFLIVAVVLALLLPGLFERAVIVTRGRLGRTFLIGLVASIVVPVVLAILMATVIGIPLALLGGLIWLVVLLLSGPFAAYLLGRRLLRGRHGAWLIMLVGAAILFLLCLIPWVGWIIWLVAGWFGLGAILRLFRGVGRPYHDAGAETPPPDAKPEPSAPTEAHSIPGGK